jgi:hypothetical protein
VVPSTIRANSGGVLLINGGKIAFGAKLSQMFLLFWVASVQSVSRGLTMSGFTFGVGQDGRDV